MLHELEVFQIAQAMAKHAGRSQALVAQNVANADTPGYLPLRLPDFKSSYETSGDFVQRATRGSHLYGSSDVDSADVNNSRPVVEREDMSPDGNGVSIEREILASVNSGRQHERALAIYKSALTVLHATLRQG